LCHKNIISLQDILRVGNRHTFNEVYLVMELMESNLSNVIRSKNVLSEDHIRYFIYQLFCGIHFMHSASIVHRDLKPENIFVNRKCELKIGDLNMARKLEEEDQFQT
jgi:serine/threonine protein kinase